MASLAGEFVKVCTTFVSIGTLLVLILQNTSTGIYGTPSNASTGELVEIGFWTYCVRSRQPMNLTSTNPLLSRPLKTAVCVTFDNNLRNDSAADKFLVVPKTEILITAQILSIFSLCILFCSALMYNLADMNKCLIGIVAITTVLAILSQLCVASLTGYYWSFRKDDFSMGYSWICAFVGLGLLTLLLMLILMSCCMFFPENNMHLFEHEINGSEKFGRWVFIVLFLPAMAFQLIIHSDFGGVFKEHNKYQAHHGMWRYCVVGTTEISYFIGPHEKLLRSSELCIEINKDLPEDMIKSSFTLPAIVLAFISHTTTCACFLLAIYPFHVKSYRSRRCLFVIRFAVSLVMSGCSTAAAGLCNATVPKNFELGFGFVCPWVAVAVQWVISMLCTVQCFWVNNIFGEMPEMNRFNEDIRSENKLMRSFDYYDRDRTSSSHSSQ